MKILKHMNGIILAVAMLLPGMAPAVEGQLLGVTVGHPLVDSNVDTSLVCGYTGTTLTLQSEAAAIEFTPGGSTAMIFSDNTGAALGGLLDITAQIDNTGNLISGTFTVTGAFLDGGIFGDPNPILSGDITDFGILDGGTTDGADFKVENVTGDLTTHPDWPGGVTELGVIVDLVNSGYDATTGFGGNWNCDTSKASAGPVEAADGCNLSVMKTANVSTVGPPAPQDNGDDSDSDSGRDHDHDGDSDNSDSDSSDGDSSDSGQSPMDCGCKGRVKSLTVRWTDVSPAAIVIERLNGTVLYENLAIQPGEEFTFAVSGKKIRFVADGQIVETLKTKCKNPIGPGQILGNFEIVSGFSKWATLPLCPFPGTTCDPEFEVTYTYKVTNNGPGDATNVIIDDDQLGVIDSFANNPALVSIPAGGMVTVNRTTCVFETTTNTATVFGTDLAGEACEFTPGGNVVTVTEIPAPCDLGDSDSDSGSDTGGGGGANGDSDDSSDSDSSHGDCDGDGT